MRKTIILFGICMVLLAFPVMALQVNTKQVTVSGDSWVEENNGANNYGSSTYLRINGVDPAITNTHYAYIKLDPSEFRIGRITDANIKVTNNDADDSTICFVDVTEINNTWVEDKITWNNRFDPNAQSNHTCFSKTGGAGTVFNINITPIIIQAAQKSDVNWTLFINSSVNIETELRSNNHGTLASRPNITINYIQTEVLNVTLLNPSDYSVTNETNVNFSCSANATSIIGNLSNMTITITAPDSTTFYQQNYTLDNTTVDFISPSFLLNFTEQGNYTWDCNVTANNHEDGGDYVEVADDFTITYDSIYPIFNFFRPVLEGLISTVNVLFNIEDNTLNTCSFSINSGANTTQACGNLTNITTTSTVPRSGWHNISLYANDSSNQLNITNTTFLVLDRVSENYVAGVLESTPQVFEITINDVVNLNPTVVLQYNTTDYTGALVSSNGNNDTYRVTLDIGEVQSGLSDSIEFNWTMSGNVLGSAASYTWPSQYQNVSNLDISPTNDSNQCINTAASQYTANITFRHENTTNPVAGINLTAVYFYAWTDNPNNAVNFSWNITMPGNSSYPICIFPDFGNVTADVKFRYGGGIYALREFNLQEHNFNNITQDFDFYVQLNAATTTITITVVDETGLELEDYLVRALFVDFANNSEYVVDSQITDSDGIVVMELDALQYHRFQVWRNGIMLYQGSPEILKSATKKIVVQTEDIFDPDVSANLKDNIDYTLTFSNTTFNVTGTWNDGSDLASQICLKVFNRSEGGTSLWHRECSTDLTGTLTYNIGNTTENFNAQLVATAREDSLDYVLAYLDIDLREDWQRFGMEGILWFGVIMTGTLMFMASGLGPTAVIIVGVLSLGIFGYLFNFYRITWAVIVFIAFIAMSFIISLKK